MCWELFSIWQLNHSSSEFVLDFVYHARYSKAKVKSRIVLTPQHAKRLLKAMEKIFIVLKSLMAK
jgi:hypothetical protein